MTTYGGVEIQLHAFLTSALAGHEQSASLPSHFTCGARAPGSHLIGGWVGPWASLDMVAKRNNPCPCREYNPGHPAHSLVTMLSYPGSSWNSESLHLWLHVKWTFTTHTSAGRRWKVTHSHIMLYLVQLHLPEQCTNLPWRDGICFASCTSDGKKQENRDQYLKWALQQRPFQQIYFHNLGDDDRQWSTSISSSGKRLTSGKKALST